MLKNIMFGINKIRYTSTMWHWRRYVTVENIKARMVMRNAVRVAAAM